MATKGSRRRRGADSRERYREAFFDTAGTQLQELASLVVHADEETDASTVADLERLADTAGTLGLGQLERAARSAARDLPSGRRMEALRLVAQALRRSRGARRLGPILVVAGTSSSQALRDELDACAEPIHIFPTMEAFTDALHVDEPTAVCLPVEAHDAVRQLAEYESFPVLVHGPASDVEALARAMASGCAGYIDRPIALSDLTHQARWRSTAHLELMEVLLLMDPGPGRDKLQAAFEAAGMRVVPTGAPADLGPALDRALPDAIVLGAEVHGVPCGTLAGLVRGHGRCGHLPVMVCGKPRLTARLREAGIDDLMRDNAEPHQVAQRIRERVHRFRNLPFPVHLPTGLRNRLGVLDALDVELRRARRDRHVVTVALLQVDGTSRNDPAAARAVTLGLRQAMAGAADASLRRTDAAGELLPGTFLLVMPQTTRVQAESRIHGISAHLAATCAGRPELQGLSVRVGIADTEASPQGVVGRAERDLSG